MNCIGPLCNGGRKGCLRYLSTLSSYYTYILRRPDGRPFYVGKGSGPRVFDHENEARHPNGRKSNSHKLNVIRAAWREEASVIYEISAAFADEAQAYENEETLIRRFRRLHEGGILTNRDPGGGSTSGPSPFSLKRHSDTLGGIPADDIETATLNQFVLAIGPMRSVVLKPISRFQCRPTLAYPRKTTGPSLRQAIALVATAAANGIFLNEGVRLPRTVCVDGVDAFVENGVSCDIATSGMARVLPALDPKNETFELDGQQIRRVVGMVGLKKASDLGISDATAFGTLRK